MRKWGIECGGELPPEGETHVIFQHTIRKRSSFTVDSGCSSNGALWTAVNDIRQGFVDAASQRWHDKKSEAIVIYSAKSQSGKKNVRYNRSHQVQFCSSGRIPEGKPIPTM
ncbi:hypothetical protein CEXT_213951 [Caerostris extrusa]|uniref:Uncharacterized protein n=1 Tax=Caerostris extrusa TaxID=172846 RepID=A0AAV4XIN7_CAEEX|nr:hypothetical protein CEXT_213951 [Caerostris extrusa]